MRDALADLLQAETQYAPVVDARGADRRRALGRDHLRVPHLAGGADGGARRGRAAARRMTSSPLMPPARRAPAGRAGLPPSFCHHRAATGLRGRQRRSSASAGPSTTSTATSTPLLQHLELVVDLGRRSASRSPSPGAALPPPPLAASRRSLGVTGVLYTIPSIAFFFLLLPITGRGLDDRDHRPHRLHAADHLPQHRRRARQRPGRRQGRRARDGDDRPPAPLAGRAAAGRARRSSPGCGSRPCRRSRSRRSRSSPAAAGLGEPIYSRAASTFKTNIIIAGGARDR